MATAMAVVTAAIMPMVVAATKTMVATAMAGGTDNNQLKGTAEEATPLAMVTAIETATAMETVTVTATITMSTPMTADQQQRQGQHTRYVSCHGGGGRDVGGEVGERDSNGRESGNDGSKRGVCRPGRSCAVYFFKV